MKIQIVNAKAIPGTTQYEVEANVNHDGKDYTVKVYLAKDSTEPADFDFTGHESNLEICSSAELMEKALEAVNHLS